MAKKQPEQEQEAPKRGRPPVDNPKEAITLRLDPDVLAYLRENYAATVGSTVNTILANYIKRKQRA